MLKKLFSSGFASNVLTLASGTGLAQLIPFLFYPILSRLFTEGDYAVFGLYLGIFEFLAIIITGRYELTVVLPKSEFVARNIVAGSIILSFCLSLLVLILVIFLRDPIGLLLNNTALSPYLFFLPVILFIYAVNRILIHWLIRKESFKSISFNKVFHKSTDSASATALGSLKVSSGLIVGDLIGRSILLVLNARSSFAKKLDFSGLRRKSILLSLERYKNFPLYNSIPALANSLANILPVFLISAYYNETASGNFNFSRIILAAPIALISTSISQVLSQKLSERYNKRESVKSLLASIILFLGIVAALMILILFFGGPYLFSLIFGSNWEFAGEMTSILVFGYGIQFILVSLYPVFFVFNAIKIGSAWQLFFLLMISSLFIMKDYEIFDFLRIYVVLLAIAYLIYGALLYYVTRKYERSLQQTGN